MFGLFSSLIRYLKKFFGFSKSEIGSYSTESEGIKSKIGFPSQGLISDVKLKLTELETIESRINEIQIQIQRNIQEKKRKIVGQIDRLREIRSKINAIEDKINEFRRLADKGESLEKEKEFWDSFSIKDKKLLREISEQSLQPIQRNSEASFLDLSSSLMKKDKELEFHRLKSVDNVVSVMGIIDKVTKNVNVICGSLKKKEIYIYNIKNTKETCTLSGHTDGIACLVSDPNKGILISAGYDGNIILWDIETKEMIKSVNTNDEILSLALFNSLLFAGGTGKIFVYDFPQLTLETVLEDPDGIVLSMCIDRDKSFLYAGEANLMNPESSCVYAWDLQKISNGDSLLGRLRSFGGWITSLTLKPDGKVLAAGEGIGDLSSPKPSKIIFWDTETFRITNVLEGHEGWVEAMVFLDGGKYLVSGDGVSFDGKPEPSCIYLWNIESEPQLKLKVKAHKGWVRVLFFSNEMDLLVSGGTDGVIVWQASKLLESVN